MTSSISLYKRPLALLVDLYELTMAQGYSQAGMTEKEAIFNLSFRKHPFRGGFTVACGLQGVIDFLERFSFTREDIDYLSSLPDSDGRPLFEEGFLDRLREMRFVCDLDAVPEGTVVFPGEPLVRVRGPLLQAQILETALLTLVNFSTLIATKAARVCLAAKGDPVIDFGLRRAQGIDGGITAARAAYIGGCAGTSNVLAGELFQIPVKGTHAHSWVMSFPSELEAFMAYAEAMPDNSIFLVDTYDPLQGVRNAIEAGRRLLERGHRMKGIRIDSGDLAYLSIEARKLLDQAGFSDAVIVASGELDEYVIQSLKQQAAKISAWGVGTKLITGHGDAALGGVYKLGAIRDEQDPWEHKIKIYEQIDKIPIPGELQVRRYEAEGLFAADQIFDQLSGAEEYGEVISPYDPLRRKQLSSDHSFSSLLIPVFRKGQLVYDAPRTEESQARTREQLAKLHPSIKRFENPHEYPVGLAPELARLRRRIISEVRGINSR